MSNPTLVTFRDTLHAILPTWLQSGRADKLMFAIGVQLDAIGDAMNAGVQSRFPNLYSDNSLDIIGRERRIRRGRVETSDSYAERLKRWWDDHAVRGGPYALLTQLYAFWAPNNFPTYLLYRSGAMYQMDGSGSVTRSVPAMADHADWARWTLLFITDALGPADATDIALVPREWIAAHCLGEVVVMGETSELWDWPPANLWDESGQWDTPAESFRVTIVGAG